MNLLYFERANPNECGRWCGGAKNIQTHGVSDHGYEAHVCCHGEGVRAPERCVLLLGDGGG